ncbi:uncharacterized protein LOC124342466 [Daphnia pulicaria]|uniref:uncharacterized protein LOC124342466 n=1 Tax=Daphnia pulicaria TaxID=35523 RepID=UPI001EEA6E7D|nr:uncharacterized protein LOC124342466 [Daphnia pulicaria]
MARFFRISSSSSAVSMSSGSDSDSRHSIYSSSSLRLQSEKAIKRSLSSSEVLLFASKANLAFLAFLAFTRRHPRRGCNQKKRSTGHCPRPSLPPSLPPKPTWPFWLPWYVGPSFSCALLLGF